MAAPPYRHRRSPAIDAPAVLTRRVSAWLVAEHQATSSRGRAWGMVAIGLTTADAPKVVALSRERAAPFGGHPGRPARSGM